MRITRSLFLTLCCSTTLLAAEQSKIHTRPPREQLLAAECLSTRPTRTRKGKFSYGDSLVAFSKAAYLSGEKSSATAIVGLRNIHLQLGQSVAAKSHNYWVFCIEAATQSSDAWTWQTFFSFQPDLHHTSFSRSTRYITNLHGAYGATAATRIHVGARAEMGMRAAKVDPIIGVDHQVGHWLLEAIYPCRAGISYLGICNQKFSAAIRPFYAAVRSARAGGHRPAIATYTTTGAELRWDWVASRQCTTWLSFGSTVAGRLKLGDRNNNHRHSIRTHTAPYLQLGCSWAL